MTCDQLTQLAASDNYSVETYPLPNCPTFN